jgi:hypothetical protein
MVPPFEILPGPPAEVRVFTDPENTRLMTSNLTAFNEQIMDSLKLFLTDKLYLDDYDPGYDDSLGVPIIQNRNYNWENMTYENKLKFIYGRKGTKNSDTLVTLNIIRQANNI